MKKLLAMFLALVMVLSLLPGSALTANAEERPEEQMDLALLEQQMKEAFFSAEERPDAEAPETVDPNEVVRVIVELAHQPALSRMESGNVTLASAQQSALSSQEAVIQRVARELNAQPVHRMSLSSNAVSYEVRRCDMEKLAKMPGVVSVTLAAQYEPEMFSAKEMAGVYEAWKLGQTGYTGKGMTIAVIDTGVNYLHQDMVQDPATAKYTKAEMEAKIQELGYGTWYSDKVPFGYNYAGGTEEAMNLSGDSHGHHVAGIAAANGDEEKSHVAGVAPDAQILAMQVWDAVSGVGGFSDDIICAIEDAVKLGADVINMSLGTDCGFYGRDRYIARAVDAAEAEGVFVSVAAGNFGITSDDDRYYDNIIRNNWNITDTAAVSDPSTAKGAVSVASVDSHGYMAYRMSITDAAQNTREISGNRITTYPFDFPNGVKFFNGGGGDSWELNAYKSAANGAIAVVRYNPVDNYPALDQIFMNAYNAGCAGLILYNKNSGGGLSQSMAFIQTYAYLPSLFVSYDDGQYLLELCSTGESVVTTGYTSYFLAAEETLPNTASAFSSWGPTPSLELKPELAAPGGNVFSLLNGTNEYAFMSGTSMAAPFVAGAAAVVKQQLLEAGLDVDDIPDYIRKNLMNTAMPVYETPRRVELQTGNVPSSVRQVGAGMIHVDAAVRNRVIATYHGKAAIELYDELGTETTGQIVLTNYGKTDVTYTPGDLGIYMDYTDPITKDYYITPLDGASIVFDADSVTVPAGGEATLTFTLKLERLKEGHFVEGYLCLNAQGDAPSLSLPLLGFMGDWDEEPIVDAPCWEDDAIIPAVDYGYYGRIQYGTTVGSRQNGYLSLLGEKCYSDPYADHGLGKITPEYIAISPNGDGYLDEAIPLVGLVRNAKEIRMDVLDSSGNVVADCGSAYDLRKVSAGNFQIGTADQFNIPLANNGYPVSWNGCVRDPASGAYQPMPEGDYTIRLRSQTREGGDWQTVELPVAVDLTAPEIISLEAERQGSALMINFRVHDTHGIHDAIYLAINGTITMIPYLGCTYNVETDTYSYRYIDYSGSTLPYGQPIHLSVMFMDKAGNEAVTHLLLDEDATGTEPAAGLLNASLEEPTYVYAGEGSGQPEFRVYGFAPEGSTATFNGVEASFVGTGFSAKLPLNPGENLFEVKITSPDGETLLSGQANIVAVTEESTEISTLLFEDGVKATAVDQGHVYILGENFPVGEKIRAKMKLTNPECMSVSVSDYSDYSSSPVTPDENGYISFELTMAEKWDGTYAGGQVWIDSKAFNGESSNSYYRYFNVYIVNPDSVEALVESGIFDPTPNYMPQLWNLGTYTVVNEFQLQEDGTFRILGNLWNPVDRLTINGVDAVINPSDLTWYCDIQLANGTNNLEILSQVGEETYACGMQKVIFSPVPELALALPEAADGVIYTDSNVFAVRGTVATVMDDAQVYVNGASVLGASNEGHGYAQERVTREFSYDVNLVHGMNRMEVVAYNSAGSYSYETIDVFYCPSYHFTDVNHDAYYHEGIDFCLERGMMIGVGENQMAPNASLTRGQLVTVLYRLSGETVNPSSPNPFTDVKEGAYYHDAIVWAYVNGIAKGITQTTFCPNALVTREQAATFLYRYVAEYRDAEAGQSGDLSGYSDAGQVSGYAKQAMAWAVGSGIIQGMTKTTLVPQGTATRAQLATIILRFSLLMEQ